MQRGRFWAGVASVAAFMALFSMVAAGFLIDGDVDRAADAEQAAAARDKGRIVQVRSGSCSKIDFDNSSGRLSGHQSIPCPDGRGTDRDHQLPANRFKRFSKGFQR